MVINRKADQLASGLAITFLGLGVTAALGISFVDKKIHGFDAVAIPRPVATSRSSATCSSTTTSSRTSRCCSARCSGGS